MGDEFKVTDIQTGRIAYRCVSSTVNKGLYLKLQDARAPAVVSINSDGDGDMDASATTSEAATSAKPKKTKIKRFSPKQKYNILTEALHGNHTKLDGTTIEFQNRNKHGNLGPFFASICKVLNDGVSYPAFTAAKAVDSSVRQFVETAMGERLAVLIQKYSANFHENRNFMDYTSSAGTDSDGNGDYSDARYNRFNIEHLDSLIHLDKIHELDQLAKLSSSHDVTLKHSSEQEEEMIHGKVDKNGGGGAGAEDDKDSTSKKRKHKLERPREKKVNPNVQLQEQQSSISSMLDKLMQFSAEPVVASASAPADSAIRAIHQSLLGLPKPPGTESVCEKLAESLAGYGFTSFQELLDFDPRADARAILIDLKWSPLQIQKVLGAP